jgi:hypothetical protein
VVAADGAEEAEEAGEPAAEQLAVHRLPLHNPQARRLT